MIQKDYALAAALQKLVGFGSHFPIRVHPEVDARAPEQQQLRDEHLAQLREVRLRSGERHALRTQGRTRLLLVSSCTEALLMLICAYVWCLLPVLRALHSPGLPRRPGCAHAQVWSSSSDSAKVQSVQGCGVRLEESEVEPRGASHGRASQRVIQCTHSVVPAGHAASSRPQPFVCPPTAILRSPFLVLCPPLCICFPLSVSPPPSTHAHRHLYSVRTQH